MGVDEWIGGGSERAFNGCVVFNIEMSAGEMRGRGIKKSVRVLPFRFSGWSFSEYVVI